MKNEKKSGLVAMKFNENVDPESYGIVILGTNIFENVVFVESNQADIPNWFKENTKWYLMNQSNEMSTIISTCLQNKTKLKNGIPKHQLISFYIVIN